MTIAIEELEEQTRLSDAYFPINVFDNRGLSNTILGLHWHEHLELILMVQGEAVFHIGNQGYQAKPGDLLFVGSRQLHVGYAVGQTTCHYYAVVFKKTLLSYPTPDMAYQKYIAPLVDGAYELPGKISPGENGYAQIIRHVHDLIKEFQEKQAGYELAVKAYLQLLVAELARTFPEQTVKRGDGKYDAQADRLLPLFDYVAAHYGRRITVAEAAAVVHVSQHYFCSMFKKAVGCTFVDYVQLYRIQEAERLLTTTDLSISTIAERVGFGTINYFDRVFRRIKRYAPSQLRKSEGLV